MAEFPKVGIDQGELESQLNKEIEEYTNILETTGNNADISTDICEMTGPGRHIPPSAFQAIEGRSKAYGNQLADLIYCQGKIALLEEQFTTHFPDSEYFASAFETLENIRTTTKSCIKELVDSYVNHRLYLLEELNHPKPKGSNQNTD